jgi:nicotinate dehydrogenase subunit B
MKRQQKKRSAPEQDELPASPGYQFNMNRRNFFGALGSGIAISFTVARGFGTALGEAVAAEDQVSAWIHVGENGTITVYTGKAEVGQNIRTSLAQVVAEELFVPIESIVMVMGDTDLLLTTGVLSVASRHRVWVLNFAKPPLPHASC